MQDWHWVFDREERDADGEWRKGKGGERGGPDHIEFGNKLHACGNYTIVLRLTRGHKVRRRSRVAPRTLTESATGKSTSATDTDVKDDTALNCVAVPMKSASDLSGFDWSPFCMYHCLTSVVQLGWIDGERWASGKERFPPSLETNRRQRIAVSVLSAN